MAKNNFLLFFKKRRNCFPEGYGRMMARNRSDSVEQKAEKYEALFSTFPSGSRVA
jgi:hypothetical protein